MKRLLCIFILLLVVSSARAQEQKDSQSSAATRFRIEKIHIQALDAFDPSIPAYRSWPFRFLNKVHICTNASFIRRELLVHEGEYADQDLLEESERNLRRYRFLDDVRITTKRVGPDRMDVYVHTEDQWTTQLDFSAGHSAGFSKLQFSVEESNFLGLGKSLTVAYDRNPERSTYDFLFFDPQFLNTRWNFNAGYRTASDGRTYTTEILRPFYSLDTKWAYGMLWDSGTDTKTLYTTKGGAKGAEIDRNLTTGLFFAARSWGERYDKKRFGMLFTMDNLDYPHPARIIFPEALKDKTIRQNIHPIAREDYQYGAIFQWDRQKFIEQKFLDNFGRVEDLPNGVLFASTFTRSEDISPAPDFYQLDSLARYTSPLSPSQYLALDSEFSVRRDTDGHFNNLIFNGYGHYYLQMERFRLGPISIPRQTLATSLSAILTKDVDAPFQISLGEDEGLRGYNYKSFTGENKILLNIEDRIFTPFNYRLVAIGLAGFLDTGYVWSGDEHLRFSDLPLSVGLGLRIGLKKAQSARVVRVDFAIPLRKINSPFAASEQKGYSISVSSGQIFTVLEDVPRLFRLF